MNKNSSLTETQTPCGITCTDLDYSVPGSLLFPALLATQGNCKLFLEKNTINQSIKLLLKLFINDAQNETKQNKQKNGLTRGNTSPNPKATRQTGGPLGQGGSSGQLQSDAVIVLGTEAEFEHSSRELMWQCKHGHSLCKCFRNWTFLNRF